MNEIERKEGYLALALPEDFDEMINIYQKMHYKTTGSQILRRDIVLNEAHECYIKKLKSDIRDGIIRAIDEYSLIEYSISDNHKSITGKLHIYPPANKEWSTVHPQITILPKTK